VIWAVVVAMAVPAWAATWTVKNVVRTKASNFNAVSCQSVTRCYAVGDVLGRSSYETLIEHWDGARWSLAAYPSGVRGGLVGVSCYSWGCLAVGVNESGPVARTLIERWSGSGWHIVPTANPTGVQGSQLDGIACASSSSCVAVGYSWTSSKRLTLAETWNGTSWSIVKTPNPATKSTLENVSCVGPAMCVAVGNMDPPNKGFATIWNGTHWTYSPIYDAAFVTDVTCLSTTSCLATGFEFPGNLAYPLVEQWNGYMWVQKKLPNPAGTNNQLFALSCATAKNCVVAGIRANANDPYKVTTLVEHWDGTKWYVLSTPNPSFANWLFDVDCRSACIAVGYRQADPPFDWQQGLAEHRL
jgi:hypothetical protein